MLIWTKQALSDLDTILHYISEYDDEFAHRLAKICRDASKQLEIFPKIGVEGRIAETRELFITTYPYLFIYRIHDKDIEILRVLHSHQQRV